MNLGTPRLCQDPHRLTRAGYTAARSCTDSSTAVLDFLTISTAEVSVSYAGVEVARRAIGFLGCVIEDTSGTSRLGLPWRSTRSRRSRGRRGTLVWRGNVRREATAVVNLLLLQLGCWPLSTRVME